MRAYQVHLAMRIRDAAVVDLHCTINIGAGADARNAGGKGRGKAAVILWPLLESRGKPAAVGEGSHVSGRCFAVVGFGPLWR